MKTKEELKSILDNWGVEYDKRLGQAKLQALVDANMPTDQEIAQIRAEVEGKNTTPIEETLKITSRPDGEAVTKSGIVVPQEALAKIKKTKWIYEAECQEGLCIIYRMLYNGHKERVREYTKTIHGEDYKRLAQQFVHKFNA